MFIDEAVIHVKGGKGGNGCLSFRREKYVARGGPDGGDGGTGGNVVFVADHSVQTLLDFQYRSHYSGGNGGHGSGKNMTGRDGETVRVHVPCGTILSDLKTSIVLADLTESGAEFVAVRGGRGGRGNKSFATATNRVPRECTPGQEGEQLDLKLQLKLIADIGLVGFPNAGKSTLLSVISAARPKIANYPFTTLEPYLGIVELPGERRFVIADIPGLIEGAHQGTGLGDRFLRHIERTRVLLYVLDGSAQDGKDPVDAQRILENELSAYSPELTDRPFAVAVNKMDLPDAEHGLRSVQNEIKAPVFAISGLRREGLRHLLEGLWKMLPSNQTREE